MLLLCIAILFWLNPVGAEADMPPWLKKLSGRDTWPGDWMPPYVPEPHHRIKDLPRIDPYWQGNCDLGWDQVCSFDCHQCTRPGDIETSNRLIQTFDDGPSYCTHNLLDGLKKSQTKTSFFLVGSNVVQYPEIVRREIREGHVVGVHTWSHPYLPSLSNQQVFAELQWCVWAINATTGIVPRFFRPPYGGMDDRIRVIAARLGLVPVLWDKDTDDWKLREGQITPREIHRTVDGWLRECHTGSYNRTPSVPKGIILEHDLFPETVSVALRITSKIKHRQMTVAQVANQPPYQRKYSRHSTKKKKNGGKKNGSK